MEKNSQMIEQIFTNIDMIGEKMEKTIDLSNDVAPYMSATLAKIKQLALAKENAYEAQFELFQIATNYLPRTINAYCALPIEYRNTREIKSGKNARQFLIDDLKIFKNQVNELEKQFYNAIESEIKINSNVVRAKYDNKFQLATELDNMENDGFIDQFNFSEYKQSPDYKNIVFKKEKSEEDILNEEKQKERKENLEKIKKETINGALSIGTKVFKFTKNAISSILEIFVSFLESALPTMVVMSLIFGFFYGIYALISSAERPRNFYGSIVSEAKQIHDVMSVSLVPENEFKYFVDAKQKELLDDSSYRKERTNIVFDAKSKVMTMNFIGLDRSYCYMTIDRKELTYDAANMSVNGISLPQDNTVSNFLAFRNENHKLCHLEEGNKISIQLDNQKIYDYAQKIKSMPESEKATMLSKMNAELTTMKAEMEKYSSKSSEYGQLYNLSETLQGTINSIKGKKN